MWHTLKRLDRFLDTQKTLLLAFLLITVLRLPNFFEPYWYGDEAIYLTIGHAITSGERLYADIVDHKTPLIYFLATVPNQLSFRILLFIWMIATTASFWWLLKKLHLSRGAARVTLFAFVLLTTLPTLEGNIPNGELFLMLWSILSLVGFLEAFSTRAHHTKARWKWAIFSGVCGSLAFLTKVPALFDLYPIFFFSVVMVVASSQRSGASQHTVSFRRTQRTLSLKHLSFLFAQGQEILKHSIKLFVSFFLPFSFGFAFPIIGFLTFFAVQGSLQEFWQFGVAYNFRYAGTWQPTFPLPFVEFFFRFPVKLVLLGCSLLLLFFGRKKISSSLLFFAVWLVAALFASTLSNRPYPHYFLQIVPPLAGLIGELWIVGRSFLATVFTTTFVTVFQRETTSNTSIISILTQSRKVQSLALGLVFITLYAVANLLRVGVYPTVSYYSRFWQLITKQISAASYENNFDRLVADNRRAAALIRASRDPYMYIWGTNPTLYAQTKKIPTGLFTVSFHVHDFNAHNEEYTEVVKRAPEYIVVMNQEKDSFPKLNSYIEQFYMPNTQFEHFVLWRRSTPK